MSDASKVQNSASPAVEHELIRQGRAFIDGAATFQDFDRALDAATGRSALADELRPTVCRFWNGKVTVVELRAYLREALPAWQKP